MGEVTATDLALNSNPQFFYLSRSKPTKDSQFLNGDIDKALLSLKPGKQQQQGAGALPPPPPQPQTSTPKASKLESALDKLGFNQKRKVSGEISLQMKSHFTCFNLLL